MNLGDHIALARRSFAPKPIEARAASVGDLPLLEFVQRVSPRFQRPDHLAALATLFERARREPVMACVSVPPRHGKTELLLHGIAWTLRHTPEREVGYVSYEASLARAKSRLARDYATSAGVALRDDANSLHEWLTPHGGGLRCGGVGGPMTGHGFGILVIDDPFKNREEAESFIIREKVWNWFTSTALTRLEPMGSVFLVHTRWHHDDTIGRCLEQRRLYDETGGEDGGPWEFVNLQAISDATGEALWPKRWPVPILMKRRRIIGEYDWASLFQGDPRKKGGHIFGDPVRYEVAKIEGARILISVDVAGTKSTQANHTIAVASAYSGYGDEMTEDVLEVNRWQETVPEVARRLGRMQQRWGVPMVIEAAGIGKSVVDTLLDLNPRLNIIPVYPTADKFVRAQAHAGAWQDGRVRVPMKMPPIAMGNRARGAADAPETWWGTEHEIGEYVRVHKGFTGVNDAEDDDVDAGAHGWNYANAQVKPTNAKPPPLTTFQFGGGAGGMGW